MSVIPDFAFAVLPISFHWLFPKGVLQPESNTGLQHAAQPDPKPDTKPDAKPYS
jgi:hypothetical protein